VLTPCMPHKAMRCTLAISSSFPTQVQVSDSLSQLSQSIRIRIVYPSGPSINSSPLKIHEICTVVWPHEYPIHILRSPDIVLSGSTCFLKFSPSKLLCTIYFVSHLVLFTSTGQVWTLKDGFRDRLPYQTFLGTKASSIVRTSHSCLPAFDDLFQNMHM